MCGGSEKASHRRLWRISDPARRTDLISISDRVHERQSIEAGRSPRQRTSRGLPGRRAPRGAEGTAISPRSNRELHATARCVLVRILAEVASARLVDTFRVDVSRGPSVARRARRRQPFPCVFSHVGFFDCGGDSLGGCFLETGVRVSQKLENGGVGSCVSQGRVLAHA